MKLIDETSYGTTRGEIIELPKPFYSDKDSVSNYSDRNSVLTGKSDIPLVQIHPPKDNSRTTNKRTNPNYHNNDRHNQRNMGSDRRAKRYSESDKVNPDSDRGYNTDRLSVSSYQGSYLSPVMQRPRRNHSQQNGSVTKSRSPKRLDDVVLATQKQTAGKRPRTRARSGYNRYGHTLVNPLPGTTPDKTVFPEKITLKIRGFSSPKIDSVPKKVRRHGVTSIDTNINGIPLKRTSHKASKGLHSYDNEGFNEDADDDDAYSSSSSWIGVPWNSYKLPPGFEDPNAEDELSV